MSEIETGSNNPGNNPSDQEKQSSDTFTLPETGSDQPDKKSWDFWKGKQKTAGEAIKKGAFKGLAVAALAAAGLVGIGKCAADSMTEDTGSSQSPADTFSPSPSPEETTTSPEDSADSTESPDAASTDYPTPGGETRDPGENLTKYRQPLPTDLKEIHNMSVEGSDVYNYQSRSFYEKQKYLKYLLNDAYLDAVRKEAKKAGIEIASKEEMTMSANDSKEELAEKAKKHADTYIWAASTIQTDTKNPGCAGELDISAAKKVAFALSDSREVRDAILKRAADANGEKADFSSSSSDGVGHNVCMQDLKGVNIPPDIFSPETGILAVEEKQSEDGKRVVSWYVKDSSTGQYLQVEAEFYNINNTLFPYIRGIQPVLELPGGAK